LKYSKKRIKSFQQGSFWNKAVFAYTGRWPLRRKKICDRHFDSSALTCHSVFYCPEPVGYSTLKPSP